MRDADGGGRDCVRMHCVRTQMVVDAGEGKEIIRKKEKNLLGVDGRHCVRTRCVCKGYGCG